MWARALARWRSWRHTSGVSEQHRLARLRLPAACLAIAQQVRVTAAEVERAQLRRHLRFEGAHAPAVREQATMEQHNSAVLGEYLTYFSAAYATFLYL